MRIWIERDFYSGHLMVHTEVPVRFDKGKGKKYWVNEKGQPALWRSRIDLDMPWLKPGEIAEFSLVEKGTHQGR